MTAVGGNGRSYTRNSKFCLCHANRFFMWAPHQTCSIQIIVYISAVKQNGDAELGAIYLLQEYQGAGIGTALLQQGFKKLVGAKALFISVEKENLVGVDFYLAKGFQMLYEFEDDLNGHVSQMIRMSLDLTSVASAK